ncbi:hypothetical protein [Persicobacter sp. CCB-QB2]|uniref:hypothetical protein n=1 Tax=Persicobacter sp. CCB-QB2 TaxID=1561025 RepID=UPI0006A9F565|nr:hypothetical protein [Persicobacter sp. CCB-QB2]
MKALLWVILMTVGLSFSVEGQDVFLREKLLLMQEQASVATLMEELYGQEEVLVDIDLSPDLEEIYYLKNWEYQRRLDQPVQFFPQEVFFYPRDCFVFPGLGPNPCVIAQPFPQNFRKFGVY